MSADPAPDAAPPVHAGSGGSTSHEPLPTARDSGVDAAPTPRSDAAVEPEPMEPVACSDQPPPARSACSEEGEVCSHRGIDPATGYQLYFACQCRARTSTELVWDCYENESNQSACPSEAQNGADCFGYKGLRCAYPPQRSCECPELDAAPRWRCEEPETPPEPDSAIDPDQRVSDMSAADREAWCQWLYDATVDPGWPAPPDLPPDASGFYPSASCMGCVGGVAVDGMMPIALPLSACVANLALSTCEASVADFNDCIRSMMSACWPQPRGCARFFEAPGCKGTIASPGSQCRVRIE